MTDEEKKEYTECLNCDFWASEDKCAFCKGYSHFQPNDETKVFLLEKENEELKKRIEQLDSDIKELKSHCKAVDDVNVKLKNCMNCNKNCCGQKEHSPCSEWELKE